MGTEYQGEPLLTVEGAVSVLESGRLGDPEQCREVRDRCRGPAAGSDECIDAYDACLAEQASEAAPWESAEAELRVALFWSRAADDDASGAVLEQAVEATSGFPANYELTVYTPPSQDVMRTSDEGEFGLAVVLVYLDLDGDDVWDGGSDRIVGGAAPTGVLFTESTWSGFEPGFHQVEVPRGCEDGGLALAPAGDEPVDLRLSVAPTHLDGLLPDVDCDRATVDWPMCPEREAWLEECKIEDGRPPDPWRCTLCADRPIGPPQSQDGRGGGGPGPPGGGGPPPRPPPG